MVKFPLSLSSLSVVELYGLVFQCRIFASGRFDSAADKYSFLEQLEREKLQSPKDVEVLLEDDAAEDLESWKSWIELLGECYAELTNRSVPKPPLIPEISVELGAYAAYLKRMALVIEDESHDKDEISDYSRALLQDGLSIVFSRSQEEDAPYWHLSIWRAESSPTEQEVGAVVHAFFGGWSDVIEGKAASLRNVRHFYKKLG